MKSFSLPAWLCTCTPASVVYGFALLFVLATTHVVWADGDETLGPIRADFEIATGDYLAAAGAGVEFEDHSTLSLDIPDYVEVLQVLLYWGMRALPADDDLVLNGELTVTGELIGTSPGNPASNNRVPHVFRSDITSLGLFAPGANAVTVSGIEIDDAAFKNGVEVVVIGKDTRAKGLNAETVLLDGCDFAYVDYQAPYDRLDPQALTFQASDENRTAELILVVGDHVDAMNGDRRPSTLEVKIQGGEDVVLSDPLVASDGDSWDTIRLSLEIPAGSTRVDAQLFSDTRTKARAVPSSFYWLFAGLNVPITGRVPAEPAGVSGVVFCDFNENGALDDGEPGVGGVAVTLDCPATGEFAGVNETTDTADDGSYAFTVIVEEAAPICTVTVDASSPAIEHKQLTSESPQTTPPLDAGSQVGDVNFGFHAPLARVGGTVFNDLDGNGILDDGEPPLAGVEVSLDIPGLGIAAGPSAPVISAADGSYLFVVDGLPGGDGLVGSVAANGETGEAVGKRLTTANPQETAPLVPGLEDLGHDFGYTEAGEQLKLAVEDKSTRAGSCVDVRVLLTTPDPVEGFLTAIRHDAELLSLESITIAGTASEANGADFVSAEVLPNGGTLGVILDFEEPFSGNEIPPGSNLPIAIYRYCCAEFTGNESRVSPLELVDGVLGTQARDNVVVVGGLSLDPLLCNGSVTCEPTELRRDKPYFACGGPELGPDNLPVSPTGGPGETVELCFYYCSPEDNLPGHEQFDQLQGFTMALEYDCRLRCLEDTLRVPDDTITSAIEADFVSLQCDNDPTDGDGCELLFAALADLEPPFDGTTFPPGDVPRKLACVDMRITEDAPCGECLPIVFRDGINGPNVVPVKNLYSAENESFPAQTVDCEICITGQPMFRRADCNLDGRLNIADSAAAISYLFPANAQEEFVPECLDACDVNDDGRVNLTDIVAALNWQFLNGAPPPPPGPSEPGSDPTEDKLTCRARVCPDPQP